MKISFDVFSPDSVEKAKQSLKSVSDNCNSGISDVISTLSKEGCEYMKSIVKFSTGELKDSISWTFDKETNTGKISVGAKYAVFVEYGTGIVGELSPHPQPAAGWTYDSNGHGESGWTYYDERANQYFHTKGQPANAFVWKTVQYLKQRAKELAQNELQVNIHV
ncbi:MAG: HK97 gp10 family phage protein [Oscillospiraceae bacterium]|nr:HK97 gp10 family phage protein [Oscillospiraceae bacterium]